MSFHEHYTGLSDEALLMIAASRADLVQEAAVAMDSEMARRGLTYQEAHAKRRQVARLEYKEAKKHLRSPKTNKYFVAKANGWMLLLLALGVPVLVIPLMAFHVVSAEWELPILSACEGAVMALISVQPWLRRTVRFWLSFVISCVVQLLVGYWISVHQPPRSGSQLKGAVFLAIFAGYAVGAVLFLLIQRLKPKEEAQGNTLPGMTGH